jgi:hypothetical protein
MDSRPPNRPLGLILLNAFLALFQLASALRALQIPPDLAARLSVPIPLEAAAGLAWAALFARASAFLVKRRTDALRYSAWVIAGFLAYSAARLALFARADYDRQRLPFLLAASGVGVVTLTVLLFRSMRTRSRENRQDGSEPQSR